jgi:dephospho-CoA kinase
MPFILGITGGIGSGKTTATTLFENLGIQVIDADIIAKEVVQIGSPSLHAIAEHFGNTILLPSGDLDRAALRECIFKDAQEKKWLEQLLHPVIKLAIKTQLQAVTSPYGILSSPLLFETQQDHLVSRTLVIDCSEQHQQQRAIQRDDVSLEQVNAIMASQLPRKERNNKADDIITNNDNIQHLEKAVHHYHTQLLTQLASSSHTA